MPEMKYVIIRGTNSGHLWEFPFVFSSVVMHNVMADLVRHGMNRAPNVHHGPVVGAGFWNGKTAHGRSESLNIDSRSEDTDVILSGGRPVEEPEPKPRASEPPPPKIRQPSITKSERLRNRFNKRR